MRRQGIYVIVTAVLLAAVTAGAWWWRSASSSPTIRIGSILGLTGPNSAYGHKMLRGFQFAIEEINGAGGINGKRLEIVAEDSQFDPIKAVNAYRRLAGAEEIQLIVGVTGSKNALAVCSAANGENVIILDALSSAPKLTTGRSSNYFRIMASDVFAGRYNIDWAVTDGMKRPVIVYQEDEWGASYRDSLQRYFAEKGYTSTPAYGVTDGTRDFKTHVLKLRSGQPDVIFLLLYAGTGAAFVRELRQQGVGATVYGSDNLSSGEFTTAGSEAIEGVRVAMPAPASGPLFESFVARFKATYDDTPDANVIKSYDAMKLMAHAIAINGTDPGRIVAYLSSPGFTYQGVSGTIQFDRNGDLVGQQYTRMVYRSSQLLPMERGAL